MYIEDEILSNQENIRHKSVKHWITILQEIIISIIVISLVSIAVGFTEYFNNRNEIIILGIVSILLLTFIFTQIKLKNTKEYVVTEKRVIIKEGILSIDLYEILHSNIESIEIDQSLMGRIFNYGTIEINGTGNEDKRVKNITNPIDFRKAVSSSS